MIRPPGFCGYLTLFLFPGVAASLSGISIPPPIQKVVVVGGTHGNEYTGVWCIKAMDRKQQEIKADYPSLDISTLLANPEAYLANRRFIHEDLNRQFTHDALHGTDEDDGMPKTVESLRAKEINELLGPKFDGERRADVIVDLHTTTTNMGVTVIVAEGDELMTRAAAYVLAKCGCPTSGILQCKTRCLLHTHPSREVRPNLSSTGTHGFTIEVGPVPQGVIRHDAVENTQKALAALLEFLHRHNKEPETLHQELVDMYAEGQVPCFRSAQAKRPGEMSGKIVWPTVEDNPNFPAVMVHKSLQDRDFHLISTGDPLFLDLDGNVISYDGSHGSPVHLIFVNEGGYYYSSSGTGIGVAVSSKYDLKTGYLVPEKEEYSGPTL